MLCGKSETHCEELVAKSKKYKQELKRVRREEKTDLISKLRSVKTKDSKLYWQILQEPKQKNVVPVMITEPRNYFERLSKEHDVESDISSPNIVNELKNGSVLNREIPYDEVVNFISKMKSNKDAGIDNISNVCIKSSQQIVCLPNVN